jgi:hypothetical protein
MLTREDYRQLAERCELLAGECGAPGVAEALRALALDYLTRVAEPILNSRERIMQTSASGWGGTISSADQLRLVYRAPRSASAPCAEIRLRSVQSGPGRGQANR